MKLITVVLPVYNVEEYLESCLDSLINQTFKKFKIIAVNDGSTDSSLKILEKYEKDSELNIKIISQKNQGLSDARNAALDYIETEYVYFMDSDDLLDKHCFMEVSEIIKETSVDLVKFDALPFSDDVNYRIKENEYCSQNNIESNTVLNKAEFLKSQEKFFNAPVWLYIFKIDILKKNSLKFKSKLIHEDELFTPILFSLCNSFYYIPKKHFKRRYRQGSIMTSKKVNVTENNEIILKELVDFKQSISKDQIIELEFLIDRIASYFYIMNRMDIQVYKNYEYFKKEYGVSLSFIQQMKIIIMFFKEKTNEIG